MIKILLISPLSKGSGNLHTIERIRTYLSDAGYCCTLLPPEHFSKTTVNHYVTENHINLIIGLHAFRAGKVLHDVDIPYIIVIGGTDVNELYKDKDVLAVMTKSILSARKIVAFSNGLLQNTRALWPEIEESKILTIKQGVNTLTNSTFSLKSYIQKHHPCLYRDDMTVCVCMGSIRPVKNPLFLVHAFSELHQRQLNVLYVICGPVIDKEYGELFKNTIRSLPGVIYIPGLPLADAHAAINKSFAFINSSNSEGMALAVLEAMLLNVPVIVRDIDGNKEIVKHEETGLLFSKPEECISHIELLLNDKTLRDKLIQSASQYVNLDHSLETERRLYCDVVKSCLNNT